MNNDFLNELLKLHPELHDEYNSSQYKMSLVIIDEMMELSYNSKKMAKYLDLDYDVYIRMESGDTSISVEEYERVIKKIEEKKINLINDDLVNESNIKIKPSSYSDREYILTTQYSDSIGVVAKTHSGKIIFEVKHHDFKAVELGSTKWDTKENITNISFGYLFNNLKNLYKQKVRNNIEQDSLENKYDSFPEQYKYIYS